MAAAPLTCLCLSKEINKATPPPATCLRGKHVGRARCPRSGRPPGSTGCPHSPQKAALPTAWAVGCCALSPCTPRCRFLHDDKRGAEVWLHPWASKHHPKSQPRAPSSAPSPACLVFAEPWPPPAPSQPHAAPRALHHAREPRPRAPHRARAASFALARWQLRSRSYLALIKTIPGWKEPKGRFPCRRPTARGWRGFAGWMPSPPCPPRAAHRCRHPRADGGCSSPRAYF